MELAGQLTPNNLQYDRESSPTPLAAESSHERAGRGLPNQLLWAFLRKRGLLVLSVMHPNEATAVQGFAGEAEKVDVQELDSLRSLVMYSGSKVAFDDILREVDVSVRPRPGPPSRRPQAAASTANKRAGRTFSSSGSVRMTALGVALVIGVAVLGGVMAGVVVSFGPSRLLNATISAILCPVMRLLTLLQHACVLTLFVLGISLKAVYRAFVRSGSFTIRQALSMLHVVLTLTLSWLEFLRDVNAQFAEIHT
ncbi:hypothetical protein NMY22_g9709 [Coprinellus aureogranulatus]|nr:hypothetical protein NMY22_g9709 [Coprinellus aureogranulatus]